MKIEQTLRASVERKIENRQAQVQSNHFSMYVKNSQTKFEISAFNRLISDIEQQGRRVATSRTFKDLAKFKSLIKKFVEEAVDHGLGVEQERGWNMEGNSRTLSTVQEVDTKLVELTQLVLDKQRNSIDILEKIGEIKGLLINLYI